MPKNKQKILFSDSQLQKLSKSKKKIFKLIASFIAKIFGILPTQLVIAIKEELSIIRKMDYSRGDILISIDSQMEYARLFSCKKEPETIDWIETFVKPGDVIFDIGANVGAYSLVIDKFTNGKSKIYAFEPSFSTFAKLTKNIFLNKCQGRVIPFHIALSEKTELGLFNYTSLMAGTALHTLGEPIDYKGDFFAPVFKQLIISYRIDDLVKFFNIQIPNHIKLDVDGIELSILKGAEHTLENPLLKTIIVEVEENLASSRLIAEFLWSKGFEIRSSHRRGTTTYVCNYIFVRRARCTTNNMI